MSVWSLFRVGPALSVLLCTHSNSICGKAQRAVPVPAALEKHGFNDINQRGRNEGAKPDNTGIVFPSLGFPCVPLWALGRQYPVVLPAAFLIRLKPARAASGRAGALRPSRRHGSWLGRRAPGGKHGPAAGGGSAGAGTAARPAPPRLASWNSRALPPMAAGARPVPPAAAPARGGAGPTGDLGVRSRPAAREGRGARRSSSACGRRARNSRTESAGSAAASSALPGAGRATAARDNLWIMDLQAASCGWEPVLPSFNFSSCSSWDVCVLWGIDANFGAWLLEFIEHLQILLLYATEQLRVHFRLSSKALFSHKILSIDKSIRRYCCKYKKKSFVVSLS